MPFIDDGNYSSKRPDPYWRASRIAARLLLRSRWSARDRRLASKLLDERGVEERLIEQAISGLRAVRRSR